MNRIKIDRKLLKVNDDSVQIDIYDDGNFLLEDIICCKYVFNIYSGNVNIFSNINNKEDIMFEFNIENANVVFNSFNYDCGNERITVNLNENASSIIINNSFVCLSKQKIDINVHHNNLNTKSNVYNCAVTDNYGSIKFNVITKVPKGMKNSMVSQDSKIITLNDDNKNEINPILLIDEMDSSAEHSAFIGKFKNDEIFYMMSRGISFNDAIKLLIDGVLIGIMDISIEEKNILRKRI